MYKSTKKPYLDIQQRIKDFCGQSNVLIGQMISISILFGVMKLRFFSVMIDENK